MTRVQQPFVSYAQNGEDVVLWRALRHVDGGRYVDVGANAPDTDSVTKAFYDRGWCGLDVEPVAQFAEQLRAQRPRDAVTQVAVTRTDQDEVVLHEVAGTGLSTLVDELVPDAASGHAVNDVRVPGRRLDGLVAEHLGDREVHFCKIDVEGAEADVLAGVDLRAWRPWVLVVEATRPNSTESAHAAWEPGVLDAGYELTLFDGLSRFYVAAERAEQLRAALSYPACVLDGAVRARDEQVRTDLAELQQRHAELQERHHLAVTELAQVRGRADRVEGLEEEVALLRRELVRWRGAVLDRWAAAAGGHVPSGAAQLGAVAELEAMRRTVSWRVTRPLRMVRGLTRPAA